MSRGLGDVYKRQALNIYDKFCEEGNDTKDFSAISKVVGGDAWNYPID